MMTALKGVRPSLSVIEITANDGPSQGEALPGYLKDIEGSIARYFRKYVKSSSPLRMAISIARVILIERPNLIISNEYRRSFLINLVLCLFLLRPLHIVIGMNLSSRPIKTSSNFLNRIINAIFRRSSKIIVHSTYEAHLFGILHDLPDKLFAFSHWGYDLPSIKSSRFSNVPKPFACMIGRNNRDLHTFAAALKLAGIRGIAIIPSYIDFEPGHDVELDVYRDLSMDDCIDCIRNAAVNLTLLRDDQRGAGHITIVTALHLGVPQIHSDAQVLKEYVPMAHLSRPVPIGDVDAVASAILKIMHSETADLPIKRQQFARQWLSHSNAARRVGSIVRASIEDEQLPLTEPKWDEWVHQEVSSQEESS